MHRIKFFWFFYLLGFYTQAQDLNFTFFEAAPIQINPALAGKVPHYQIASLYRNRWIGLEGFQSYYAAMDYHFDLINGGAALAVYSDRTNRWQSNTVEAGYSQSVRLSRKWVAAPGIKFGYTQRQVGYQDFVFGDEIVSGNPTLERLPNERFGFLSIGTGVLVHSRTVWLGLAAHHINSPNESPVGLTSQPIRISAHAGLRIMRKIGKRYYDIARPSILLERQGAFSKIDVGSNFYKSQFFAGAWLRILPMSEGQKTDALSVLTGYRKAGFRLAYSFGWDLTGVRSDFGTHEIVLNLSPTRDRRKKKGRKWHDRIQCPFSALEGIYD